MASLLSRAYVYTLVPLLLLLIGALLIFHVSMLAGSNFEPNGRFYALVFGINLPIIGLAERRNIWANEVTQCPSWLSFTFGALFVYAFVIALMCVFVGNMYVPADFFLASSAFMLAFTFGSACILWVTVQSAKLNTADFHQRTRRSLVCVVMFSTFYFVSVFLPPKPVHY